MNAKLTLSSLIGTAAIGLSTMVGAASAAGTNIVQNGDFADDFTGWHATSNGKFEIDNEHGVLANTFGKLFEDSTTTVYQCVPASDAKNYQFFGAVYIPSGQERHGYARLVTTFYPTNNCNGVPLDTHKSQPFHDTGAWLTDSGELVRLNPKAAYSLKVELVVKKDSTDQVTKQHKAFIAKFDNIKVMETGKPSGGGAPVFPAATDEPAKPPVKQPVVPTVTPTPGQPKLIPPMVQPGGAELPSDDVVRRTEPGGTGVPLPTGDVPTLADVPATGFPAEAGQPSEQPALGSVDGAPAPEDAAPGGAAPAEQVQRESFDGTAGADETAHESTVPAGTAGDGSDGNLPVAVSGGVVAGLLALGALAGVVMRRRARWGSDETDC
jgi:hypothetical protein